MGCQQAEDQAKAEEEKKEEEMEEGGEEKGAEEEEERERYEEATADKLRAQLEKVRASAGVKSVHEDRKDWTETESDKELRKALEVAIEMKVSLKELNFSWANLAKMK